MVTEAQRNAGRILINVKNIELKGIHDKLVRLSPLAQKTTKEVEFPYTEENMDTLFMHALGALVTGNLLMMHFWMQCILQVGEDIEWYIKQESRRRHQIQRIGCIADRYSDRIKKLQQEVKEISNRIGGL